MATTPALLTLRRLPLLALANRGQRAPANRATRRLDHVWPSTSVSVLGTFTIDDVLGGWRKVRKEHFSDGGVYGQFVLRNRRFARHQTGQETDMRANTLHIARGLAALGALAATLAQAAEPATGGPAELQRRALAATCANCHGTQGKGIAQGELPPLAGASAAYLAEQLHAFRNGTRPATVMHQIAKGYTPAQIDTLAAYFAAQPR